MKLLIYGINYAPELTGIGKYSGEMAAYFAASGHEVEVITAPPYYPNWEVAEAYKGRGWMTEELDGVRVLRCPLYVPKKVSGVKRIIHEFSFLLSSLRYWIPRYFRSYDAIIVVSPPFHLGAPALLHKWLRGTSVVNHIQDLQVDAARDLGIIKSEGLLRLLERTERFLLHRMDIVSTISTGMRNKLRAKAVSDQRIVLFPNWVDDRIIYPISRAESLRSEWGFTESDKVVLYAGNLGEKQGLDLLLDVADRLRDRSDIHFVIVGEGGIKAQLMAEAARRELTNVQFKPLQPLEKLAACLAAADVHLILQKKAAADLVMPSKLTNILAVNGHALITAEPGTTLYEVVSEYRLGTLVEPEEVAALEKGTVGILAGQHAADAVGASEFARTKLNKARMLNEFLDCVAAAKSC